LGSDAGVIGAGGGSNPGSGAGGNLGAGTSSNLGGNTGSLGAGTSGTGDGQMGNAAGQSASQSNNDWRYVWHNGEWWYWTAQNRWMIFRNGNWVDFNAVALQPMPAYSSGYTYAPPDYSYGDWGERYYGGYQPYWSGYGNYGRYGGYGWGNRGVWEGANVGGAIGGAVGGWRGAEVGAGIGAGAGSTIRGGRR
jgi:hypothetical protein